MIGSTAGQQMLGQLTGLLADEPPELCPRRLGKAAK